MKWCSLLTIFFLLIACDEEGAKSTDFSKQVSDFHQEYELDKRTTYLDIEKKGDVLRGFAESKELKTRFLDFVGEKNSDLVDSIEVITNPTIAYVNNSVANVRDEPKHAAQLTTQYLLGQALKVYQTEPGWYYIQGPDNYLGWVDAGGVVTGREVDSQWEQVKKEMVYANEAVAQSAEEPNQNAIDLVFGNTLVKLGSNQYLLPDGRKVIIQDESIFEEPSDTANIARVLEKANSLAGRPYLWGGTSTKGMDCSGFTRMAFLNADYLLGRDASLQVKEGQAVDVNEMSEWQPGDLLFFGSLRDDGSQRITHVAIHEGNGRMIHSSQRVRKESLNPSHADYNQERAESLLAVRRIF